MIKAIQDVAGVMVGNDPLDKEVLAFANNLFVFLNMESIQINRTKLLSKSSYSCHDHQKCMY